MNMDFLPDLDFNWLAEFDKERYTILNPTVEAISKGKQIDAILKFFTDLGGMYLQDEVEDKSMTALNAYTELFQGTGKTVHLVDNFHANTLNYQKNQSRLERFHYYNERFKAEFVVRGDAVYLYNRIGSYKPDVRIDEDLNVKSATVEIDSENFFTWCKCYFDVENTEGGEDENYQQDAVYINHELYDKYGDKEGPALYQGNIRHESTMLEYAREQQEKSIQVSHSVTLIDLQRQGYGEFLFNIGDTVRLSLSSIDTTVDIRVVEINETFVENAHGEWERTELILTLGNASKVQSYKQSRNDALQDLGDWINGRREPPMSVVPAAIRRASDIINGDTDSVMDYRKDRLIGHHDKNAGNNVQLNVSGLEFVRDGVPKTAITYEGVYADSITGGTFHTNNATIEGTEGIFLIDGDELFTRDRNDPDKFVRLTPENGLHVAGGKMRVDRDDGGYPTIIAGRNTHGQRLFGSTPYFMHPALTVSGQRVVNDSSEMRTIDAYYFEHYFNAIKVYTAFRNNGTESYTGRVGISGFGGLNWDHAESVTVGPGETAYKTLRFPIGIPDGNIKQFYIQFASLTSGTSALISILDVKNYDM